MAAKNNRIGSRKVTVALAAAVALCLAGNAAMAGTITYNFNTDGSLADSNGQNPLTVSAATGWSAAVSSGDLKLSNDGTQTTYYGGVHVSTPFSVSGDFDASVAASFPTVGNDQLIFIVNTADGSYAEDYFGFGGQQIQARNSSGQNISPIAYVGDQEDGTFVLSRTGQTITASYIVNGATVNSQTFTDATLASDATFSLVLQHAGSSPAATALGTFDDLTISGPNIAVPEPASLGLLAVGGLALLRRRRRGSK